MVKNNLLYIPVNMVVEDFWKMTKEAYLKLNEEDKKKFLAVMFDNKKKKV